MAVSILIIFLAIHATTGWRMIPPKYSLVKKMGSFEIRKYPTIKVARAQENDVDFYESKARTFTNLYKYIIGENDQKKNLGINLPLISHVIFGQACHTTQYYGRNYFIPKEYQEAPPLPSNNEVKIEIFNERTMLVRSFGGWTTRSEIVKQMDILKKDLNGKGFQFESSEVYVTELSAPWEVVNRTNEIAFKSTGPLPDNIDVVQKNPIGKLAITTENRQTLSTEDVGGEEERKMQEMGGEFVKEISTGDAPMMRPIK